MVVMIKENLRSGEVAVGRQLDLTAVAKSGQFRFIFPGNNSACRDPRQLAKNEPSSVIWQQAGDLWQTI
jgi:hypothetical protein